MTEITDDNYEERKRRLYRDNSSDPIFLEAKNLIKYQSRRIGSLQGWNTRYRQRIELLKQAAEETATLRQQLQRTRNALMITLQNKASIEADYDVALKELEKIDDRLGHLKSSYELATKFEKGANLKDRWMILLQAIKDLLFPPDDPPPSLAIKPKSPNPSDDRNSWNTEESVANIQRDLRENG